jgi:hypothetical protein
MKERKEGGRKRGRQGGNTFCRTGVGLDSREYSSGLQENEGMAVNETRPKLK